MSKSKDWNKEIIKEFRENEGRVGGYFENSTLLLLHTIGAKSGEPRVNPLMYINDGEKFLIIASNNGGPSNPDWYHNIMAEPEIVMEAGTEKFKVLATIVDEPERTSYYSKMAASNSNFAEYENKTERVIPAIILSRL